jgi:hypothetical protein
MRIPCMRFTVSGLMIVVAATGLLAAYAARYVAHCRQAARHDRHAEEVMAFVESTNNTHGCLTWQSKGRSNLDFIREVRESRRKRDACRRAAWLPRLPWLPSLPVEPDAPEPTD